MCFKETKFNPGAVEPRFLLYALNNHGVNFVKFQVPYPEVENEFFVNLKFLVTAELQACLAVIQAIRRWVQSEETDDAAAGDFQF